MKLEYYNPVSKQFRSVRVKPMSGLAQAFKSEDGQVYRVLPTGKVLNGYFGIEIGIGGSVIETGRE